MSNFGETGKLFSEVVAPLAFPDRWRAFSSPTASRTLRIVGLLILAVLTGVSGTSLLALSCVSLIND